MNAERLCKLVAAEEAGLYVFGGCRVVTNLRQRDRRNHPAILPLRLIRFQAIGYALQFVDGLLPRELRIGRRVGPAYLQVVERRIHLLQRLAFTLHLWE